MTNFRIEPTDQLDLITVERQARALRAEVMANGIRAVAAWVRARIARAPQGHTA